MASYTPLLRFVQPSNGDLAWGGTVNNGFTALADAAIAGTATVDVTFGDQTLTNANGADDQARKMVLNITGTPNTARSVTVPSVSKIYFVKNGANAAVTVTTASSGVAVPVGASMVLRVDGTDVVQAFDYVQMTGAPTAPTAAFGTNTTQLATTAFVQAAIQALHPVGSIYINAADSTNPATLFGFGTWVAFGAGRVPVGFDSGNALFDAAEETGGSADAIVVDHNHSIAFNTSAQSDNHTHAFSASTSAEGNHNHAYNEGYIAPLTPSGQLDGNPGYFYIRNASTGDAGIHSHTVSGTTGVNSASHVHAVTGTTANEGSAGTNANYQPYITVYMWKRTA